MAVYRTVSDLRGEVKLEAIWHPFVTQADFSFEKTGDTLALPIVGFLWPQRYSVETVSIKWRAEELTNPDKVGVRVLMGIKGQSTQCYLDTPIGAMSFDPFGFYFFCPRHKFWIPSDGFAAMELYSLSDNKQSGNIMLKLDGEYFRKIGDGKVTALGWEGK